MANPVIGRCPICSESLRVVRLDCEGCGTRLEGNFTLGRFQALTADQLEFLETQLKDAPGGPLDTVRFGIAYERSLLQLLEEMENRSRTTEAPRRAASGN